MTRCQYCLLILVGFIGGLIGGFLSNNLLSLKEFAFAQDKTNPIKQKQIYAETIIAEQFFLHDKKKHDPLDGQIPIPRALLTTEPNGNPKLIMQDTKGNPRFSIQLRDEKGTTLAILNKEGKERILLSEKSAYGNTRSGPTVALLDNNGKTRAQMGVQADNNPFLSLHDSPSGEKSGHRKIKLCLKEKDMANISLYGVEGVQRTDLNVDSNNTCFSLRDLKGKIRAELGNTELAFGQDGSLKKRSYETLSIEKRTPSSLVLYNEDEKALWSAP